MQMMINNTDPGRGHFYVSIVKSLIRIAAGVCLIMVPSVWTVQGWESSLVMYAGILLIMAEVLGIVEEIV
jgi:hypothetical protein